MALLDGKYPAKLHAQKVVERIKQTVPGASGMLYLEGQKTRMIEDNDETMPFRQRRCFYYLTGCNLPDSYLTYDIEKQESTLFIAPIDPESVMWSGLPVTEREALELYDVDIVKTSDELFPAHPRHQPLETNTRMIWLIENQVSDHVDLSQFSQRNLHILKQAIEECRVVKDPYEVALMRKANDISTIAHTAALKAVKHSKNERELEALFIQKCIENGARNQAYHSIVASGESAATLHYVKNNESMVGKLNLLLDAGGEYQCYASDITRTFPISGKFSNESRAIYDIVLKMQQNCTNMLKADVHWEEVHLTAHKIAIEGLLSLGILKGNESEILKQRTSVAFFPHGLGHYLGMDVHDTGGHPDYTDKDTMFRYLRVRGRLPAGSIVTVEPGIYFCRYIIEPYMKDPYHSKFIDAGVLDRYWTVGGVRIEDNVLITDNGFENLTSAVKDVDEIEGIIAGL